MRGDTFTRAIGAALRGIGQGVRLAALGLACALAPLSAEAADILPPEAPDHAALDAPLHKSIPLRASGAVGRVVVSQPELVEAGVAGPRDIYLIGRDLGTTNLLIYDTAGRLTQTMDVRVGYDAQSLRNDLAEALPDEEIAVTSLASGLLLEGDVSSVAAADTAMRLAQATAPDGVVSRLAVGGATVRIDVRIVEVSQRRLQEVGAGLALDDGHVAVVSRTGALGPTPAFLQAAVDTRIGQYRLQAALRALEDLGEARVVAEPTLVAKSGAVARFRAGGELPVPVPADELKVVVEFRPYGAALDIKPDVLGNGAIRLQLQAELSEPDPLNQIAISGVNVPALIVRRVATTVDLRDGETFLLAGLLEDERREAGVSTPGLSKIPFIRDLLGAKQSRDTQRELAILVTPHLGKAAASDSETIAAAPVLDEKPPAAEPVERVKPRPRGLRGLYTDLKTLLRPPVRWIGGHVQRLFAADRGSVRRA